MRCAAETACGFGGEIAEGNGNAALKRPRPARRSGASPPRRPSLRYGYFRFAPIASFRTAALSSHIDSSRPYLGRAQLQTAPHNRFSRTPQPHTAAPPPLKHRSTDPPRAYPLVEGDPKGTLVGVQRRLLAFEGVVSRTTPRGSRNAPQNRLRFGGKIRPSGEPEGMARAKRAAEGGR